MFELYDPEKHDSGEPPSDFNEDDYYEQRCEEYIYDDEGHSTGEICGGKVVATGGQGYYNGSYQCYTLYLKCENCGPYEVECV